MKEELVMIFLPLAYIFTFLSSTFLVRKVVKLIKGKVSEKIMDVGFIVGICENFIVITLILVNEFLALSIIFTAKTIVRSKDIAKDPKYYLVGTMMNFTYSLFIGLLLKSIIRYS